MVIALGPVEGDATDDDAIAGQEHAPGEVRGLLHGRRNRARRQDADGPEVVLQVAPAGLGPGTVQNAEQHDGPVVAGSPGGAFGQEGDQGGAEGDRPAAAPFDSAVKGSQKVDDGRRPGLDFVIPPTVEPCRLPRGCNPEHSQNDGASEGGRENTRSGRPRTDVT